MNRVSILFLTLTLFLLLPMAANARQGKTISFLLEGGKAWVETSLGFFFRL